MGMFGGIQRPMEQGLIDENVRLGRMGKPRMSYEEAREWQKRKLGLANAATADRTQTYMRKPLGTVPGPSGQVMQPSTLVAAAISPPKATSFVTTPTTTQADVLAERRVPLLAPMPGLNGLQPGQTRVRNFRSPQQALISAIAPSPNNAINSLEARVALRGGTGQPIMKGNEAVGWDARQEGAPLGFQGSRPRSTIEMALAGIRPGAQAGDQSDANAFAAHMTALKNSQPQYAPMADRQALVRQNAEYAAAARHGISPQGYNMLQAQKDILKGGGGMDDPVKLALAGASPEMVKAAEERNRQKAEFGHAEAMQGPLLQSNKDIAAAHDVVVTKGQEAAVKKAELESKDDRRTRAIEVRVANAKTIQGDRDAYYAHEDLIKNDPSAVQDAKRQQFRQRRPEPTIENGMLLPTPGEETAANATTLTEAIGGAPASAGANMPGITPKTGPQPLSQIPTEPMGWKGQAALYGLGYPAAALAGLAAARGLVEKGGPAAIAVGKYGLGGPLRVAKYALGLGSKAAPSATSAAQSAGATMSGSGGTWGLPKYTPTPRIQPPPLPTSLAGRLGLAGRGLRFAGRAAGPVGLAALLAEAVGRMGVNAIEGGMAEPVAAASEMAAKPSARSRMAESMGMSMADYINWVRLPQEVKNQLREQAYYQKTTEGALFRALAGSGA